MPILSFFAPSPFSFFTHLKERNILTGSFQITASMSAGSFVAAIAAGFLSDIMGRRRVLMLASVIWIIGAVIQCSSQNVAHLIAGRVISGLAGNVADYSCANFMIKSGH